MIIALLALAGFQTRTVQIPYHYAHAYDVEHKVRGFDPALGTLVAIHFDLTVTDPQWIRRTNANSYDCTVHLGQARDGCTVVGDDPITNTIKLYYKLPPPFGDGSQFYIGEASDAAAPTEFTVPANTPTFPGTFFYWPGHTTTNEIGAITDQASLDYFTGTLDAKRLSTRTFQAHGDSPWWECCPMGGGEQNDFAGTLTMRFEYQ